MTDRASGFVDATEDGDPVAVPPAHSDLAAVIQLAEYCRRRGFRLGPMIRIGSITVQLRDLRQTEGSGRDEPYDPGPWAAAGHVDEP